MASGAGLLPRVHSDFRKRRYWDSFFKHRGQETFEWYGDWTNLGPAISSRVDPSEFVLAVGCGNSELSGQMWDAGYTHHLGVDFSEPVIKEMVEKNALVRPGLRFEVMDVTAMSLDASSVHAVLDKGLLDAMIADGDEAALAGVQKFVAELLRVLKPGGRYLLVTLAQPHVLDTILRSFGEPESGCTLEVAVLSAAAEGSKLAPFLFTITKEPPAAGGHLMIREGGASAPATNVRYAQDWDGIRSFVQDAQWTHQSHSQLQELRPGNYFTFQLWGASDTGAGGAAKGTARYNIAVVDASVQPRVGVLIVPQGRETEFVFGEREGQEQLAKQHKFGRLIFASLNRGHTFGDMEEVKEELSPAMAKLVPADYTGDFPFLAVAPDVGTREVVLEAESKLSGEFVIEDVDHSSDRTTCTRRLIFLYNTQAVQSEARMIQPRVEGGDGGKRGKSRGRRGKGKGKRKAKGRQKQTKQGQDGGEGGAAETEGGDGALVVDHGYLAFEFHRAIVAGLSLVEPLLTKSKDRVVETLLVGLGGGALATFLWSHFSNVRVEAVELDSAIADVAQKYFGFAGESEMCSVLVGDGLDRIRALDCAGSSAGGADAAGAGAGAGAGAEASTAAPKKHIVIFDVDSKDVSSGMTFPSKAFLSRDILQHVHNILHDDGMLVINFGCRSPTLRAATTADLRAVFEEVHELPVPGMINVILFCMRTPGRAPKTTSALRKAALAVTAARSCGWDDSLDLETLVGDMVLNGKTAAMLAAEEADAARAAKKNRRRRKKR